MYWPLLALGFSLVLTGCATNPWPEHFIQTGVLPEPTEFVEIELVDFDEATPQTAEPPRGMRPLGYASFTGRYSGDPQRDLRSFAASVGADRVVWSLTLLHTEINTTLQPVTEYNSGRVRSRGSYGRDARYDTTTTTYVPVTRENAYYAFRAVFFALDQSGSPGDVEALSPWRDGAQGSRVTD